MKTLLVAILSLGLIACSSDSSDGTGSGTGTDAVSGDTQTGDDASSSDDASSTDDASATDDAGSDATETPSGEAKFQQLCSGCHGAEGEGSTIAYELKHAPREHAKWVVRNGREGLEFPSPMPAWSTDAISDEQLDEVLDWLHAMPQPTTGEGLFLDYCANCHGKDGKGGAVGHDLLHETEDGVGKFLEEVRDGHGGTNYGVRNLYMPSWTADQLSDAEVGLIVDHLKTL